MDFALLPPEVNSGRMYAGPGAAPMLAASSSWQALAAELESAAAGYAEVISTLIGQAWSGTSSAAMVAAVAPYVAWLQIISAEAEQAGLQANAVAVAFEAAYAATVPPAAVAANRATLVALVATNFFGQNTPAIAANEAQYAQMWAQDAVAMYGYAAAALPASALQPFDRPPATTDPEGLGMQSAALQQLAAATTPADAPAWPPAWFSQFLALFGPFTQLTSAGASELSFDSSMYTVVSNGAGWGRLLFVRGGSEGALTFEGLGPRAVLSAVASPSAGTGLGRAVPIGGLSAPPSWTTAVPEAQRTAFTLAAAESRLPVAMSLQPGMAFQEAMMGTTAGQGATTEASSTRRDKKPGDKDEDAKPGAMRTSGNGWLAASSAYHDRPRDAQPLPVHWRTG